MKTSVVVGAAIAAGILAGVPADARLKESSTVNVAENAELTASIGDTMVRVTLRESLPNAFGSGDIFGRKRDQGFVEFRYMGLAPDGRAVFRRRQIDIYSNETTMSRSGLRFGQASGNVTGNSFSASGYSVGPQQATVAALPPDTIEIALDLAKNRLLTVEDRQIEIRSADEGSVKFAVIRR